MNKEQLFMVFDVESIGLHGEGFAVGFVIVNGYGNEIQHGLMTCNRENASGNGVDRDWVEQNIPTIEGGKGCEHPKWLRELFWGQWLSWKAKGALLVADCCWPVEARFLAACVDDLPEVRKWEGPYPLHDLASVLLANRKDPTAKFPRLASELPEHNPLMDARQSARILIESLFQ